MAPLIGMEMGLDNTVLVLSSPNSVRVRHVPVGGRTFTEALMQNLNTTASEAERVKRDPTKAIPWSRFDTAIKPPLANLGTEILAAVKSLFGTELAKQPVRILACGRGILLHGALRLLRTGR